MSSTKKVLPNFVKTLVIASLATLSVSAFAGDHEGEKKMTELKDMEKKSATLKAEELTSELDGDAATSELGAVKDKAMDKAEAEVEAVVDEATPQL